MVNCAQLYPFNFVQKQDIVFLCLLCKIYIILCLLCEIYPCMLCKIYVILCLLCEIFTVYFLAFVQNKIYIFPCMLCKIYIILCWLCKIYTVYYLAFVRNQLYILLHVLQNLLLWFNKRSQQKVSNVYFLEVVCTHIYIDNRNVYRYGIWIYTDSPINWPRCSLLGQLWLQFLRLAGLQFLWTL